ncbi:MAG: hypothetical protein IKA28_07810 [Tidjanibacter sp.]|nr:hypothetical protein [Tidjanibacter sp.]MBR3931604.1 hypothetical protein [Tidjanibacter sp.]
MRIDNGKSWCAIGTGIKKDTQGALRALRTLRAGRAEREFKEVREDGKDGNFYGKM